MITLCRSRTLTHSVSVRAAEQGREGLGQRVALDRTVLADPQLVEEALVDLPADEVRRRLVVQVAVAGHGQGPLEGVLDVGQLLAAGFDLLLGADHGTGQPVHLRLEQVGRYGAGVVGVHEGGALPAQSLQRPVGLLRVLVGGRRAGRHLAVHAEAEVPDGVGGQLEALVELLDAGFNSLDADSPALAVGAVTVALGADEVVVGAAASDAAAEDEAFAAGAAEDAAAQVVGVDPVLLAGVRVGGEDVLHPQPDVGLRFPRLLGATPSYRGNLTSISLRG